VAEIVPDFRRDDVWILGFPGMTFLEVALILKGGEMEEKVEVRCRSCHHRFKVPSGRELVECPTCSQKWRLKWFDETTATILAPESWVEFQAKMKGVNPVRNSIGAANPTAEQRDIISNGVKK